MRGSQPHNLPLFPRTSALGVCLLRRRPLPPPFIQGSPLLRLPFPDSPNLQSTWAQKYFLSSPLRIKIMCPVRLLFLMDYGCPKKGWFGDQSS